MFNFTTLTVLNYVNTTNGDPMQNVFIGDKEVRINNIKFYKLDLKTPYIYLDGKPTVISVEKHTPYQEHLTKVTFDLSKCSDPGIYRVALYLGLSQNSQEAFYSNDLVYKGKPLYIEFSVNSGENAEQVAKKAVTIAKKYMLFTTQQTLLNVTADGPNLTFEGVNGYQQIKLAYLQMYDPEAVKVDCCSNEGDFVNIATGAQLTFAILNGEVVIGETAADGTETGRPLSTSEVGIEPGIEAFGDYNWLIHNLRLPTGANTSYFHSVNQEEMPVVGRSYTQFIVRLLTNRDGIGGGIVGQRATSVTTHVFWVSSDLSETFANLFEDSEIKTSADDAYATMSQSDEQE